MEGAQLIGAIIGALVGHIAAAMIAGAGYHYGGDSGFEVTSEPKSFVKNLLVEIICVGMGAAAGFALTPDILM